jgi:ferric-dicitrate binding protein FerR (iron transport regulator)
VLGTRFVVGCEACEVSAAEVEVEVEEGHVSVAQAGLDSDSGNDTARQPQAELHAGQAVKVSAGGLGALAAVSPASIAPGAKA